MAEESRHRRNKIRSMLWRRIKHDDRWMLRGLHGWLFPELALFAPEKRNRALARAKGVALPGRSRWRWPIYLLGAFGGLAAVGVFGWFTIRWLPLAPAVKEWLFSGLSPLLLMCPVLILSIVVAWLFRSRIRWALRRELAQAGVPICIECGYDLRGLSRPRCPECGEPFDATLLGEPGRVRSADHPGPAR